MEGVIYQNEIVSKLAESGEIARQSTDCTGTIRRKSCSNTSSLRRERDDSSVGLTVEMSGGLAKG
ncbi:hypothetical protein JQ607_36030 [Bradyrhizobium liaoningense]|uniref:hypothetical protein n=1 Tax=Bradyrhizobium liaoningense TaxID=43992 RepID=UPI001BAA9615|nr:hypothetical protein [Bradyrhizobium liaoningense]MBR0845629.1 hypothetical protein [Bradyrhizobium liaoningense]